MSLYTSLWAAGIAAIGVVALVLQGERQQVAKRGFVLVVSIFVVQALVLSAGGLYTNKKPVLDKDKAELWLRFYSASDTVYSKTFSRSTKGIFGSSQAGKKSGTAGREDMLDEAIDSLREGVKAEPDDDLLKIKLALVLAFVEVKKPPSAEFKQLIEDLKEADSVRDQRMAIAISALHSQKRVKETLAEKCENIFKTDLKPGWYQNAALLMLYGKAGQSRKFRTLKMAVQEKDMRLFVNTGLVLFGGAFVSIIGGLVIFAQLVLLPRNLKKPGDEKDFPVWSGTTIYLVILFWLATHILVGFVFQELSKPLGLFTSGPVVAGIAAFVSYALSNAPAFAYIYLLCSRPAGMPFAESINLKLRTPRDGPLKLVLAGFLTWCAAVPIVTAAYLLASRFLGAEGSSNKIIALVLEAARSANYPAIFTFYLTLALLAPVCEEVIFRGFFYTGLRSKTGVGLALLLSALLFSAIHFDPGAMVPLFTLGLLFGFVYEKTRSLIPSMVAHGLWNGATFTLILLLFSD